MSDNNDPLSLKNILAGIIVSIVAGVFVAFIIEDARFDQQRSQPPITSASDSDSVNSSSFSVPNEAIPTDFSPNPNEVRAVIEDPDGYTNIRSGQGTQFSIIVRVNEGEVFYTIPQQGDWWPVRTKDEKYGYIHRSRINVQD
jgi:uncharacterized protein YgiM (DUF1202 family)